MNLLMLLTVLAVLLFFAMLGVFLRMIIRTLAEIGGRADSLLAKIRLGLRAIEVETGHLPVQVATLNGQLAAVASGLGAVADGLDATAAAAMRQGGRA